MADPITKSCSNPSCTQVNPQPIDSFHKDRSNKNGIVSMCKACISNRDKLRRQAGDKRGALASRKSIRKPTARFLHAKCISRYSGLGHEWELTIEQWWGLIDGQVCHYCGGALPESGKALDRKDNTRGYYIDNVVPCCRTCNEIKLDNLTYEEMLAVSALLKQMRQPAPPNPQPSLEAPGNPSCPECHGSGLPTRKHSDLATVCEDCLGTGNAPLANQ